MSVSKKLARDGRMVPLDDLVVVVGLFDTISNLVLYTERMMANHLVSECVRAAWRHVPNDPYALTFERSGRNCKIINK